ncbi:MAG: DUF763 domain-containing protein [Ignavibacteriota bacterium]
MKRSGVADLPLHGGRVPAWLADRMTQLGTAIVESILLHYGRSAFLSRLSDPYWFQALGSVMGIVGAHHLGNRSVETRAQSARAGTRTVRLRWARAAFQDRRRRNCGRLRKPGGLDGEALVRTSRLTAKIDNNCIADGFQIYLHSFIVAANGEWAIVQQGLNDASGLARRYHWHSANVRDFVADPHTGIAGRVSGHNPESGGCAGRRTRGAGGMAHEHPDTTLQEVRKLVMPRHHDVRATDVDLKRLGAVLAVAYERDLKSFADLLLVENLGPRTLQTLAMVAEVVHGTPVRFSDPARFAFALGGKDGHPFPVPLKTYDESIGVLRQSIEKAKLDGGVKLEGFRRLDRFVKVVEHEMAPVADFDAVLRHERAISPKLNGRMVADDRRRATAKRQPQQMSLWDREGTLP